MISAMMSIAPAKASLEEMADEAEENLNEPENEAGEGWEENASEEKFGEDS